MHPCEMSFKCNTLSSLLIVLWHKLQYHLHCCFLSSISNIASHADCWQYFSILLIPKFISSRTPSERRTTSFVMSSLSINIVLLIALKNANSFAKHSKIYLSFSVGLNFETDVTTFQVLFANFVFLLEARPMAIISSPFVQPPFTIFGGMIIVDAYCCILIRLILSSYFFCSCFFFLLSNRIFFKILNFVLL